MRYVAPIKPREYRYDGCWFEDAVGNLLPDTVAARDLTEFYAMKARQAECGKTGHWTKGYFHCDGSPTTLEFSCCAKCGADLTKGENHG